MSLLKSALNDIWRSLIPWSAAHPMEGKLVSLPEDLFYANGFQGRFKPGDIVFGKTVAGGKYYPVIYAVKAVREYQADPTMDIVWELRLLGGYGSQTLDILYASGRGEDPRLMYDGYFRDVEAQSWRPKLNYYVEKVVRNGQTIWDVGTN